MGKGSNNLEWDTPRVCGRGINSKDYDVKITVNKSGVSSNGRQKDAIRIGFYNTIAEVFKGYTGVKATKVGFYTKRIYFMCGDRNDNFYSISYSNRKEKKGPYFSFTPKTNAIRNAYLTQWVRGKYPIKFDSEEGLYYISIHDKVEF